MENARLKVYISLTIILLAGVATVGMSQMSYTNGSAQSSGILIDFGDWDVNWTSMELKDDTDSISALKHACSMNGYSLLVDGVSVTAINGLPSAGSISEWSLWTITKGDMEWKRSSADPSSVMVKDYTVVAWALGSEGFRPSPGVDGTGVSIYGYDMPNRIVSLAPSVTETICAIGAKNSIVGTDLYSNYPQFIVDQRNAGNIAVIGGFTNPSYEMVMKCDPALVMCYGSQQSHIEMAEKVRNAGVDAVVLYDGEDIQTMYDNIFIAGMSISYGMKTSEVIKDVEDAMDQIKDILITCDPKYDVSTMMTLSTLKSPWVAGSNTYIDDIIYQIHGKNIYHSETGWVQITAESIPKLNPSAIILISSDYSATEADYRMFVDKLSPEWKSTDAYKNDNIYLLCEGACDLASRAGPRFSQLTELTARILHGGMFDDGIEVPHWVGNDYTDYLTITKDLGFNN